jgi:soluble lytic murein transglycosylase-like protein
MDAVIWSILESEAVPAGLDPKLVGAIAMTESSWDPAATRFEPLWKYFVDVPRWAAEAGVTYDEERRDQATSWGLMQVMGSVARELGYTGRLADLRYNAEAGAALGCKKLAALLRTYPQETDAIAAYNAGSPRRLDDGSGRYVNAGYVDAVYQHLAMVEAWAKPDAPAV